MSVRIAKIAGFIFVAALAFRYGEVLRDPFLHWLRNASPDFLSYEYSKRNPNLYLFIMVAFNIGYLVFVWRLLTMYALAFRWNWGDLCYAYSEDEELAKIGTFLCISALIVSFFFAPFLSNNIEAVRIAWIVLILAFIPFAKKAVFPR